MLESVVQLQEGSLCVEQISSPLTVISMMLLALTVSVLAVEMCLASEVM